VAGPGRAGDHLAALCRVQLRPVGHHELHLEALYSESEALVHYPPSFNQPKPITETVLPSNINPASWIAGTTPRLFNNWFVPMTNPGLAAYAAANPAQFPAGTTGIFIPIGQWRPYLVGGNPFFGADPANSAYQTRDQEQFRLSAGLTGSVGDVPELERRHHLWPQRA
jgi:hypothetical protein